MNRIAVCVKKYSIGKSSPVLCMLDLLAAHYDAVDVYMQDVSYTHAAVLKRSNVRLIELQASNMGFIKKFKQFFRHTNRKNIIRSMGYGNYLCFDPHGFMLCKELFPDARPIYHSLELYFRGNHFNLEYPLDVIISERAWINSIKGLIIQSEERERLFRKEYSLCAATPAFILPVTYLQPSVRGKSVFLRRKYFIHDDTKIALHLGGIQAYHSCIELALTFAKLDGWVLIFHGYYFGEYINRLRNTLTKNSITNVIISDDVYENIEDMDRLVMSCDLGIAWYNDVSPNFSTAGKSSGKISAYLRFGLPVITKKYTSSLEAIEQTGCGVCVDNFAEVPDAVRKIEGNYDYYSENCRREYDAVYWFENYREKLIEFLKR
jgi:glycosyltransferase involved in cell wall biosynthesis